MDETKPWFKDVLKIAQAEKTPGVRAAVRFPLQLAVELAVDGRTLEARTENVSASGISLVTSASVKPGKRIRFQLRMPGEVMGTAKDVQIDCEGRVVRCRAFEGSYQVAATIDAYRFAEP